MVVAPFLIFNKILKEMIGDSKNLEKCDIFPSLCFDPSSTFSKFKSPLSIIVDKSCIWKHYASFFVLFFYYFFTPKILHLAGKVLSWWLMYSVQENLSDNIHFV